MAATFDWIVNEEGIVTHREIGDRLNDDHAVANRFVEELIQLIIMAILLTVPGSELITTLPVRSNEMVCNDHVGDDPYDTIQER